MKKILLFIITLFSASVIGGCAAEKAAETQNGGTAHESIADASESGDRKEEKTGQNAETEAERYYKAPAPAAADGDRFLFVGNSHTYFNDLPGVFFEIAAAAGHDIEVYDVTQGSYTLKMFSEPEDQYGSVVTEALENEAWDFVVLQENTNNAISLKAQSAMYPYARSLDKMIRNAGAQTAFLMTWSPKDGGGISSRETVQSMLSEGYTAIAKELNALLIPGGDVFLAALQMEPQLELWGEDGQHPSTEGTYLAACTAYALFFQETPEGNAYLCDLDEETAKKLQKIAWDYINGN